MNFKEHIHQEDGSREAFEQIFQEMDRDEHREITFYQFRDYVQKHISRAERKRRNDANDALPSTEVHQHVLHDAVTSDGTQMLLSDSKKSQRLPAKPKSNPTIPHSSALLSNPRLNGKEYDDDVSTNANAEHAFPKASKQAISSNSIRAQMSPEDRTATNQVEIASLRAQLSELSNSFHSLRDSRGAATTTPVAAPKDKETNPFDVRGTAAVSIEKADPKGGKESDLLKHLNSRLTAVESTVQACQAELRASKLQTKSPSQDVVTDLDNADTLARTNTAAQAEPNRNSQGLTMSSLTVSERDGSTTSNSVLPNEKLYSRIQVLEENMRVATTERNMAVTMLKELAGRVSGAVDLVNESIASKMESIERGENIEARLQALENRMDQQAESFAEKVFSVENTIANVANRLQILEEAIIKEQESTLRQLEQLVSIQPRKGHLR